MFAASRGYRLATSLLSAVFKLIHLTLDIHFFHLYRTLSYESRSLAGVLFREPAVSASHLKCPDDPFWPSCVPSWNIVSLTRDLNYLEDCAALEDDFLLYRSSQPGIFMPFPREVPTLKSCSSTYRTALQQVSRGGAGDQATELLCRAFERLLKCAYSKFHFPPPIPDGNDFIWSLWHTYQIHPSEQNLTSWCWHVRCCQTMYSHISTFEVDLFLNA